MEHSSLRQRYAAGLRPVSSSGLSLFGFNHRLPSSSDAFYLTLLTQPDAAYMVKKAIDSGTTEAKESLAQKGV